MTGFAHLNHSITSAAMNTAILECLNRSVVFKRCGEMMAASKLPGVSQLGNSPRPTSLALAIGRCQHQ